MLTRRDLALTSGRNALQGRQSRLADRSLRGEKGSGVRSHLSCCGKL